MKRPEAHIDREIASKYIRDNFDPKDRLAVVLLNKRTNAVMQRLASAEKIASQDFQAWLRFQNSRGYEVYVSMNALREGARGRTKADIAEIRHVYLDLDHNGTAAVEALLKREDLPKPNYLVNSSPDKWQVIWKVAGFGKEEAEALQRALVRETGADPAAVDTSRVLRIPGFYNHKYAKPHFVRVESLTSETYGPERFQAFKPDDRNTRPLPAVDRPGRVGHPQGAITQSHRDWAFAKRALARGEPAETIIAAIAAYRRFDKHNPTAYATLTVRKASAALRIENAREAVAGIAPEH